jgi:hypothetical protein
MRMYSPGFARVQHHIVQGSARTHRLAVAVNVAIQQKAPLGHILALQHRSHLALDFFRHYVREKTQAAAIDTQQWHTGSAHGAGGAEQTAIAPDHDHQIALIGKSVALQARQSGDGSRRGGLFIKENFHPLLLQKQNQTLQRIIGRFAAESAHQPDFGKFTHAGSSRKSCGFIRRKAAIIP